MSQIYKKMSEVMRDIGSVGKDQKNQAQGFKFRGIDQFVNSLYPALTKHGVFMAPRCVSEQHELKEVTRGSGKAGVDKYVTILMEYDFFAEDGSKVTIGPIPAEGLDSGDKATNKALSAALKYALIQTFAIPTEDMAEADLESPEIGRRSSNSTQIISTSSVNNVDKLEEAPVESAVTSRGSFRKNAAKSAAPSGAAIPSGDL
jgi:hypothetical protein